MPSPYLTYALAALTFGLAVAFFRVSDENNALTQAKIAMATAAATARTVDQKCIGTLIGGDTRSPRSSTIPRRKHPVS